MSESSGVHLNSFHARGFLAEMPADFLAAVRTEHAALFAVADGANEAAMRIVWSLQPRQGSAPELTVALLFVKAITSFQAAVLLASRGMCGEAQAITRTGLECAIEMTLVSQDPSRVQELLSAHERHQALHAQKILELLKENAGEKDEEQIQRLRTLASGTGSRTSLEDAAKRAGLSVMYDAAYRGLSGTAAHATLGALQEMLMKEGGGISIRLGPDLKSVRHALLNAIPMLIDCFEPVSKTFGRPDIQSVRSELVTALVRASK